MWRFYCWPIIWQPMTAWEIRQLGALRDVVTALLDIYFHEYERIVAPPRLIDGRTLMELLALPAGARGRSTSKLLEEAQAAGEVTTPDEATAFARRHHVAEELGCAGLRPAAVPESRWRSSR